MADNDEREGWRLGEIMVVAGVSIVSAIAVLLVAETLKNRNQ